MRRNLYLRKIKLGLGAGLLLITLVGCLGSRQAEETTRSENEETVYEERLILRNATLENADDEGNILWKLKVERTTYLPDQQNADLEGITGNLYQDGKIVLQMQADRGEIIDDGQRIFLRDNVVATDPRSEVVLQCQEVEWSPDAGLLVARRELRGSDPQVEVVAEEGRYFTKTQILEAAGEVVINGKTNPFQARTEKATWHWPEQRIESDRAIEIDRYEATENEEEEAAETETESEPETPKSPVISDRIVADKLQFDIEKQVLLLTDNVESRSVDPPLQIASNSIIWNIEKRTVLSNSPVQVVHRADAITLTANEGLVDLTTEILRLTGGARGINTRRPADLYANQLVWYMQDERIEAEGNVIYRQADPPLDLAGARAVGQLRTQRITVTGGGGRDRVLTKIEP